MGRGFNQKFFNKTGIVILSLVIGMHIMIRNRPKIAISRGFPRESPCNDITFLKIRHNLAKKSPKMRRQEISSNYLCKKEQPCWKSEKLAHLRISNSIFEAMAAYFL